MFYNLKKLIEKLIKKIYALSAPPVFLKKTRLLSLLLLTLGGVLLLLGSVWGLWFVPADQTQQDAFRILYIHVPAASFSLFFYMGLALCSVVYLIWKLTVADRLAWGCAYVGMACCAMTLLTGAIWGKPMWGAWWVWDARLTSELILFFMYLGYLGLRRAFLLTPYERTGRVLLAYLALVGAVNVPIVHYSVKWWMTLHQGSSFSLTHSSIHSVLLPPLLIMFAGLGVFGSGMVLSRARLYCYMR